MAIDPPPIQEPSFTAPFNMFPQTWIRWFESIVLQFNATVMPAGGTTGQALVKVDSEDYNTEWVTLSGGGGATAWGGIVGTLSDQTDLQAALDTKLESGDNVSVLTNNAGYITSSSTDTLTNKSGAISQWTNDSGYITSTLTEEQVQDFAWDVLTGTQTLITVTYDDASDEVDFVVEANLSNYTNDAGFLTSAPVDSVNGETGAVVLDADDIDDSSTSHKFVTAGDLTTLSNTSGTNTGDQTITLTGDATGSGAGSFAVTLANTAVVAGAYTSADITVDSKGRITAAANGSGGFTPAIFYALGSGSANLGTSLGTVPLAAASKSDTGYTLSSNEVTIGADLDGKWAQVTWSVSGSGATNRVEIRSELQVNGTRAKGSSNYTARNGTQDTGGIQGSHYLELSTGDVLRVQALRDGSTANLIADATHLSMRQKK